MSSSKTRAAPSTSPPTPNAAASPVSSARISATPAPRAPNPDHAAPHPAQDHSSGELGARVQSGRTSGKCHLCRRAATRLGGGRLIAELGLALLPFLGDVVQL